MVNEIRFKMAKLSILHYIGYICIELDDLRLY